MADGGGVAPAEMAEAPAVGEGGALWAAAHSGDAILWDRPVAAVLQSARGAASVVSFCPADDVGWPLATVRGTNQSCTRFFSGNRSLKA